jgi:hypothetical protein
LNYFLTSPVAQRVRKENLTYLTPRLSEIAERSNVGTVVVIDDYHDWSGCRQATNEFISTHPNFAAEDRPSVLSHIKSAGNRWQRSNVPEFSKITDGVATNHVRVLFGAPKYRHIYGME